MALTAPVFRGGWRYSLGMRIAHSIVLVSVLVSQLAAAEVLPPAQYLTALDEYTHLERIDSQSERSVRDYLVPLGAIEKIRGVWAPRRSERLSGTLDGYTWRVLDGYTAEEMVAELDGRLALNEAASRSFSCDARACGSSVQWANRIFQQRLLYGTEVSQRYRVYSIDLEGDSYRLLVYGSARSSDRQYLHVEALRIAP
ncbi:DUF4892 domain-containing protein [Congregibacter variabilis]|uniref:DUF4892 domain-containing protein n=1 Tax=Congregibacter variabilis TaxID=3081200 RepID=A0ABZ0I3D6_9GAMM|nr:DUF4892 domain-containing protein [Congregibacter sp. IMCC43200]